MCTAPALPPFSSVAFGGDTSVCRSPGARTFPCALVTNSASPSMERSYRLAGGRADGAGDVTCASCLVNGEPPEVLGQDRRGFGRVSPAGVRAGRPRGALAGRARGEAAKAEAQAAGRGRGRRAPPGSGGSSSAWQLGRERLFWERNLVQRTQMGSLMEALGSGSEPCRPPGRPGRRA